MGGRAEGADSGFTVRGMRVTPRPGPHCSRGGCGAGRGRGEEGHAGIVAVMVQLGEAEDTRQGLTLAERHGCREPQFPVCAHGLGWPGTSELLYVQKLSKPVTSWCLVSS